MHKIIVALLLFSATLLNGECPTGQILDPQGNVCIIDPASVPKYVNPLPLPRRIDVTTGKNLTMRMHEVQQNLLGPGFPETTVWGYGENKKLTTYPGPTLEARKNVPIDIEWLNKLPRNKHLLPVDTTIHLANPMHKLLEKGYIPTVAHLHGGHTESASDGIPEAWFTQEFLETGPYWSKKEYHYDNDQEAATLWYHDHALGITRLNVYAGLAGFYLLRDTHEDGLISSGKLPTGPYEIELVVQDRFFTPDGQLFMPSAVEIEDPGPHVFPEGQPSIVAEFFGNILLTNGKAWPQLDVEARKYRFRLLNGSDSRFYIFRFENSMKFLQIGSDDGLLPQAVELEELVLGPGERADLVVDFSSMSIFSEVILQNFGPDEPYGGGVPGKDFAAADPATTGQVMKFRVTAPAGSPDATVSAGNTLNTITPLVPTTVRKVVLFEGLDEFGRLQPMLGTFDEGSKTWSEPITENPALNATETWEIYNATADAHPIHLHLVAFQTLSRQRFKGKVEDRPQIQHDGTYGIGGVLTKVVLKGIPRDPEINETGWKDTVIVFPGEMTKIRAKFDRPGRYVWHCHILSHEDHEMMRPLQVGL